MGDVLHSKEANGCVLKWAVELGSYSVEFRSHPTIKSEVLADFVAQWTEMQDPTCDGTALITWPTGPCHCH